MNFLPLLCHQHIKYNWRLQDSMSGELYLLDNVSLSLAFSGAD